MASVNDKRQQANGSNAGDRQLGMLLACFAEPKLAAKARRPLDGKLQSSGDVFLDTAVIKVDIPKVPQTPVKPAAVTPPAPAAPKPAVLPATGPASLLAFGGAVTALGYAGSLLRLRRRG